LPDSFEVMAELVCTSDLVIGEQMPASIRLRRLRADRFELLQPGIPAPLELARDGAVLRLDRHVLPLGALRLVFGLLDAQLPGSPGRVDVGAPPAARHGSCRRLAPVRDITGLMRRLP